MPGMEAARHGRQVVAAASVTKLPMEQLKHDDRPEELANVPGAHGRQTEASCIEENLPASQTVHAVAVEMEPAGQEKQLDMPLVLENCPTAHVAHAVASIAFENVPAMHASHDVVVV